MPTSHPLPRAWAGGVSQNAGERGRGGQERPAGPGRAVPAGHSDADPGPERRHGGGRPFGDPPPPGPAPSPLSPPGTQELLASPGLSERTRGRLPAPPGADAPRESRCSRADRPTDRPPRSRPRRPLPGPPRPWLRRRHRGAPCRGLPAPGAAAARRSRAEMQRVRPSGSPHPSPYPSPPRDPPEPGSGGDGTGGGPGPGSQLGFGGSSSGLRLRPTSPRVRGSAVALVARVRGPGNWGGACARIAVPAWRPPPSREPPASPPSAVPGGLGWARWVGKRDRAPFWAVLSRVSKRGLDAAPALWSCSAGVGGSHGPPGAGAARPSGRAEERGAGGALGSPALPRTVWGSP